MDYSIRSETLLREDLGNLLSALQLASAGFEDECASTRSPDYHRGFAAALAAVARAVDIDLNGNSHVEALVSNFPNRRFVATQSYLDGS